MASVIETDQQKYTSGEVLAAEKGARTPPMMVLGLAVLIAALVGFGIGWLVFRDSGGVDLPTDVDQLLDDYTTAWTEGDGDAAVALMIEGGIHISQETELAGVSGDTLARAINVVRVNIENVETVAVWGELPYMVVAQSADVRGQPTISVYEITEQSGEPRIVSQRVYYD
ncbi:MAG: hypothetical protein OER95_09660 [Acidimicrobiia bacterium]|nr:hypothetical protein [Acidimicrobiia bacterium]